MSHEEKKTQNIRSNAMKSSKFQPTCRDEERLQPNFPTSY